MLSDRTLWEPLYNPPKEVAAMKQEDKESVPKRLFGGSRVFLGFKL